MEYQQIVGTLLLAWIKFHVGVMRSIGLEFEIEDPSFSNSYFPDPLTSPGAESSSNAMVSRFPVDHEIESKIYLWRGNPWNLEVDAVVNSTNEVST